MIQDGIELHQMSEGSVKAHHQEKEEIAKGELKKKANTLNPEYFYMTYLDESSIFH